MTQEIIAAELTEEAEQALVRLAAEQKDQRALSKLVMKYSPLIMSASHDWHYRSLGEEAQEVAQLYFLEAVNTYEPDRGVPFAAYAKQKVHGGLRTFVAAEKRRASREVRPDDQSSEDSDDTPDPWDKLCLSPAPVTPSPSAALAGQGSQLTPYDRADLQADLRQALANLTPHEQTIIQGIYLKDLPAVSLAQKLGLSKSRVSHLKKSGLEKLRRMILPSPGN